MRLLLYVVTSQFKVSPLLSETELNLSDDNIDGVTLNWKRNLVFLVVVFNVEMYIFCTLGGLIGVIYAVK